MAVAGENVEIDGHLWSVDQRLSYTLDIDEDGLDDQIRYLVRFQDKIPSSMISVRLANDPPNLPSVNYFIGDQTQIRSIDYSHSDETLVVDFLDAATHETPIVKRIRLRFRRGKLRFVGEEVSSYDGWSALNGTNWIISPYETKSTVSISVPITMSVEDNVVYGRSGCNNYRGDMVSDEKLGLSIDRISNTRKLCSASNMEIEGWYLGVLNQVTEFGFDSGRLVMKYDCHDNSCAALVFDSMD